MKNDSIVVDGLKIKGKVRENSLDIARGAAVVVMLLAHIIYFFYIGNNPFIEGLQTFGDTVAFVSFLMISGATVFYTYQRKKSEWGDVKPKTFKRMLWLILGYYIIAIVSAFHTFDFSTPYWLSQIIQIITFANPPGFTEFMINFIVYTAVYILLPDLLDFLGKNLKFSLITGLVLFVLGVLLYSANIGEPLLSYKMLLAGHTDNYRFPLLQYSIVFLIGLNLGNLLYQSKTAIEKKKIIFKFITITGFVALTVFFLNQISPNFEVQHLTTFDRWPPSIPFLLLGVIFTLAVFFIVIRNSNKDQPPFIYTWLISIGKNAYMYFIVHIVLLQLYDQLIGFQTDSPIILIIMGVIVYVAVSMIVKKINERFAEKRPVHEEKPVEFIEAKKQQNPVISALTIGLLSLITFGGLSINEKYISLAGYPKRDDTIKGLVFSKREAEINWWNFDFQYSRKLTLINDGLFSTINKDELTEFTFDISEQIKEGIISVEGEDLRLVYLESNVFREIPFWFVREGTNFKIKFQVQKLLNASERDSNYYLYYGNRIAEKSGSFVELANANIGLGRVVLSSEKISTLSINLNRNWTLIGEANANTLDINLIINQNPFPQSQNTEYTYQVMGTGLSGRLFKNPNDAYNANIAIDSLQPGIYQIQAKAASAGTEIFSSKETFVVSYPIYIAWTMDWEGYDVDDEFLDKMKSISEKYDVPISHFFNPRIYIANNISGDRANYLTQWVKDAKDRGDSIDYHIHLFHDMVRAAGVDPEFSGNGDEKVRRPQWGSIQQFGYDTLLTSFNDEELSKILTWGLNKFNENGLPVPKGFRAGGWFADLENLKSIQNAGFEYDSSGREEYQWGSKKQAGPWKLTPTTQPYRPSTEDQNSSNPAPNLDLWEFPNNGADSYTFTEADMKDRFTSNFGDGIMREKRVVTYLSHPHWFNVDEPKLNNLFDYISQFRYDQDRGPVVFKNLDEIHDIWAK